MYIRTPTHKEMSTFCVLCFPYYSGLTCKCICIYTMYMHINIYEVIWKLDKLINTNNKQLCETTLGIGMFFNEVHSCTYICKYISVDLETSRLLKIEHFPIVTLRLTNVLEWKFKNSVCTTTTDTYILFADIPQRIEIRI